MRPETCPFALDAFLMCVSLSLSAVHAVPHSDTNTNKGSLLCVNGEPVSSLRQRLLRGLTQRPQSPWRTDQLQCTSTPASLTHKSELTSACQPRWKIYLSCLFLWLTIFPPSVTDFQVCQKGRGRWWRSSKKWWTSREMRFEPRTVNWL